MVHVHVHIRGVPWICASTSSLPPPPSLPACQPVRQASSGIVSLGAAPIADRTGRKPAIYIAVSIMAFVYIGS